MLDIKSFENALGQLKQNIDFANSSLAENPKLFDALRAATIQAFEFSYGLCIRFMKRALERTAVPEDYDSMDYKDVIRSALEAGLVQDFQQWVAFRNMRNITSHAYDAEKAQKVFNIAPEFLTEALFLLEQIKKRIGKQA